MVVGGGGGSAPKVEVQLADDGEDAGRGGARRRFVAIAGGSVRVGARRVSFVRGGDGRGSKGAAVV